MLGFQGGAGVSRKKNGGGRPNLALQKVVAAGGAFALLLSELLDGFLEAFFTKNGAWLHVGRR